MKRFASCLILFAAIGGASLAAGTTAQAGVNVNEKGNSVLCKGKSCSWLKPACKKEGGKYTAGAGGTGKCNFPGKAALGFTAVPKSTPSKAIAK